MLVNPAVYYLIREEAKQRNLEFNDVVKDHGFQNLNHLKGLHKSTLEFKNVDNGIPVLTVEEFINLNDDSSFSRSILISKHEMKFRISDQLSLNLIIPSNMLSDLISRGDVDINAVMGDGLTSQGLQKKKAYLFQKAQNQRVILRIEAEDFYKKPNNRVALEMLGFRLYESANAFFLDTNIYYVKAVKHSLELVLKGSIKRLRYFMIDDMVSLFLSKDEYQKYQAICKADYKRAEEYADAGVDYSLEDFNSHLREKLPQALPSDTIIQKFSVDYLKRIFDQKKFALSSSVSVPGLEQPYEFDEEERYNIENHLDK